VTAACEDHYHEISTPPIKQRRGHEDKDLWAHALNKPLKDLLVRGNGN